MKNDYPFSQTDLDYLLSTKAIRERCAHLFACAQKGQTHFSVHLDKLDDAAKVVLEVTQKNYPDLKIPFHSRWGHFQVGGVDRLKELDQKFSNFNPDEKVRAKLDLVIVSVLLDAGAGMAWSYLEAETGRKFSKSEGLAVASYHMFLNGLFSSDRTRPYRVDTKALCELKTSQLAEGFQVSVDNPILGLEGRCSLLNALGRVVEERAQFHSGDIQRPGHLWDYFKSQAVGGEMEASQVLLHILLSLSPIWPGRVKLGDINMGDVWPHHLLESSHPTSALVPFHKLSQWLTYSLIEPLEEGGLRIKNLSGMTGLAEYRNGGLFLDAGVIALRDPRLADVSHLPSSELIVEWRALTVTLLDRLAIKVRDLLKKTEEELPLVKILEGGTWWAGRRLAAEKRSDGGPPLKIESDGTVF